MSQTAFEVLGLTPTAREDEVKHAYHQLVKRIHPDSVRDPDLQDEAERRMIQLNVAYRHALQHVSTRKLGYCPMSLSESKDSCRRLIAQHQYEAALRQLSRSDKKDSEWYFLQGEVLMGLKQYATAHQSYRQAIKDQPDNQSYRAGALKAAVTYRKHKTLPYKIADWATALIKRK